MRGLRWSRRRSSELARFDAFLLRHARRVTIVGGCLVLLGAIVWLAAPDPSTRADLAGRAQSLDQEARRIARMPRMQRLSIGRDDEGGLDIAPVGEPQMTRAQLTAQLNNDFKRWDLESERADAEFAATMQSLGGGMLAFFGIMAMASPPLIRRRKRQLEMRAAG